MIAPRRWSYVIVGLALAAGLARAQESESTREPEVLAHFKRDLKEALRTGLSRGPVEAVGACQLQAPEVAMALSQKGIRLGRASHRLRNPSNSPPDWVRPIMDAYLVDPSDRTPRTVPLSNGRSGYVEPIFVQPLCLTCHGTALAPPVAARIKELYPNDEAVGFDVGDLRGVFWVELPVSE